LIEVDDDDNDVVFDDDVADMCESDDDMFDPDASTAAREQAQQAVEEFSDAYVEKLLEEVDPNEVGGDFLYALSVLISGFMHVLHNALDDCCESMPLFGEWFAVRLRCVSCIFSKVDWLDAFKEKCINDTQWSRFEPLFEKLCPTFTDWRWGSIYDVCVWLRVRRGVLVGAWKPGVFQTKNKDKIVAAWRDTTGGDGAEQIDFTLADMCLLSAKFWFYTDVLIELGHVPARLVRYLNSCVCHREMQGNHSCARGQSSHQPSGFKERSDEVLNRECTEKQLGELLLEDEAYLGGPLCPLRGMVAPELAHGEHLEILKQEGDNARANLLEKASKFGERLDVSRRRPASNVNTMLVLGRLKGVDQDACIQNFETGLQHLVSVVELKSQFALRRPFSVCGMAVLDESKGVEFARMLRDQVRNAPSTLGLDRVTRFYFDDSLTKNVAAAMNKWIDGFDEGVRLRNFPVLRAYIACRRFVPVLELIIEQKHGRQKQRTAMRANDARAYSTAVRSMEITSRVINEAGFKPKLIRCIGEVRIPERAVFALGLAEHPTLVKAHGIWRPTATRKYDIKSELDRLPSSRLQLVATTRPYYRYGRVRLRPSPSGVMSQ